MEYLAILFFVVVLLFLISIKNTVERRFNAVDAELRRLRENMNAADIPAAAPAASSRPEKTVPPPAPTLVTPTPAPPPVEAPPAYSLEGELQRLLQEPESREEKPEPTPAVVTPFLRPREEPVASFVPPGTPPTSGRPLKAPKPSFMERNPDLEKFIGENLISKIGIAILVLAIGFFVKYAIDNDWIGPVGRVGIGVLCGGILVALAHRMRNSYQAFSSVLVGGGLAIFYFTITLAYQQFHLFSQTVAFIIMVVITAFAVVLSHLYNRQELAVIALIGGFATPFMVSNGSGNYKVLFSYLLVLNTGLLVIALNKAWRILNLLAFIFTVILYGGWLFNLPYNTRAAVYQGGFLFATLFYLLFLAINIAHNIRQKTRFIASDFGILLSNTALYFGAGLYCISSMEASNYQGLFSAAMGVFNLALSYILLRQQKIDKNILYLLIGITLTFISLTAPIQLHGNHITLFWACETVLLYWLFLKSKISIIRISSMIVWAAMVISLLMDWVNLYAFTFDSQHAQVILNKGFMTTVFSSVASYLLFVLRKKELRELAAPARWPHPNVFRIAALLIFYLGGALEIAYQFDHYYTLADITTLYLLLYSLFFILAFATITKRIAALRVPWQVYYGFLALAIVIHLTSLVHVFSIQRTMLTEPVYQAHFISHWLAALLTLATFAMIVQSLRITTVPLLNENHSVLSWVLCSAFVIFITAEGHLLADQLFYSKGNDLVYIQSVYVKAVMPIIWGICSFAFMWAGMHYKFRPLRIISLTLFTLTLLKLFAYDIRNIPVAGKIAAFFILGVLLLIVSFMYQRLKTIIIEDEKKTSA